MMKTLELPLGLASLGLVEFDECRCHSFASIPAVARISLALALSNHSTRLPGTRLSRWPPSSRLQSQVMPRSSSGSWRQETHGRWSVPALLPPRPRFMQLYVDVDAVCHSNSP